MSRDYAFNPNVVIETPFARMELPSLFCWQQAIRPAICDDEVPRELEEWMEWQSTLQASKDVFTWGVIRDGQVGGYFEAIKLLAANYTRVDYAVQSTAQCQIIFKRDLFGFHITRTALNLCLQAVFAEGIETAFFPVFTHNTRLKELFTAVGLRNIGQITPRLQDGNERDMEMFAVTARGWAASNQRFLAAQAEYETKSRGQIGKEPTALLIRPEQEGSARALLHSAFEKP